MPAENDKVARPSNSGWLVPVLVAFALGMAIGGPLAFFALDQLEAPAEAILRATTTVFLGAGVLLAIGVPFAYWALKRTLRGAVGTLASIVSTITVAVQAAVKRHPEEAVAATGRAAEEVAAWYGRNTLRQWAMQAALGLFIAFGGLLGTALLFRQIALLREQNTKIERQIGLLEAQNEKLDQQTITAEAQRRGPLSTELFTLLQMAAEMPANSTTVQQRAFITRVLTFTRAATPFYYVRINERAGRPTLIESALSPERGQLLIGLITVGVALAPLNEARASFAFADLSRADLSRADLAAVNLSGARFYGTILTNANLSHANLSHASLSRAYLSFATLSFANLFAANLTFTDLFNGDLFGANLTDAVLSAVNLSRANLSRANLSRANLTEALLSDANLSDANLSDAHLSDANLSGANLSGADLSDANLSGVNFEGATVGIGRPQPGQLPEGFPRGWERPPPGWELRVAENNNVYLTKLP